jgi:molybdate transport system substrate-binding protein
MLLMLGACAPSNADSAPGASTVHLDVYAAASLVEVFGELGPAFEQDHPGVKVSFNFAGSQQLAQQIVLGASADVFASANEKQMDVVLEQGLVDPQAIRSFATNHLVAVFPSANPGGVKNLNDLARPGLKVVVAAPEVPVGAYTLSFLEMAAASPEFGPQFRQGVLSNVVSQEENVKAVLSKVELGEADAGVVYASDAAGVSDVGVLDIPPEMNPSISYPVAPLRASPNPGAAQEFVEFVLSPFAAETLVRYGFTPAQR